MVVSTTTIDSVTASAIATEESRLLGDTAKDDHLVPEESPALLVWILYVYIPLFVTRCRQYEFLDHFGCHRHVEHLISWSGRLNGLPLV